MVDEKQLRTFLTKTKSLLDVMEYQIFTGRIVYSSHSVQELQNMIDVFKQQMGDLEHKDCIKSSRYIEQKLPFIDFKG